ncbi:hypothetical protein RYA05_02380 [Pseudomonas syringae pv. actinidiae]|nr:hypothetical protein [Pseudomonas syringae pv. actinidiae]
MQPLFSPRDVENSLAEMLGHELDHCTGMKLVGSISAEDSAFLHEGSPSNPFRATQGQFKSPLNEFNPTPAQNRGDFFFEFYEIDERDCDDLIPPSLLALLPKMADITTLRFTYLKCDFMALHDDIGMKGHDLPHSMAILLDAPRGCNLVTRGNVQTELKVGDVVLINDQLKHGAYPLTSTDKTDPKSIASIQESAQNEFMSRNCLSFLLICATV